MFPTNSLQTTRLSVEETPAPVRQSTQVLDVLSEFVPGQKLIAQIQFQLANGAYRATIAQRDVTLALPFSAKAGDSLELDVVETEGRIAFAVSKLPTTSGKEGEAQQSSANTTLSRTGQLIGQLLGESDSVEQKPAPLNGGEPVLKTPPTSPKEIAPALQQAISRSGLFYESHQAAWIGGKVSEANLRQEPQAQLSRLGLQNIPGNATLPPGSPSGGSTLSSPAPGALPGITHTGPGTSPEGPKPGQDSNAGALPLNRSIALPDEPVSGAERTKTAPPPTGDPVTASPRSHAALPPDLAPLVQQQLSSLANHVYPFQGAIWPGQQILWEIIDEDGGQAAPGQDDAPRQWKTRLKLLLPSLGDIDATLQLEGSNITIQMKSSEADTQSKLKASVESLRNRLDLAGLRLTTLEVKGYGSHGPER